ncbi:MAG: hypothetical protein HW384_279 [Dehalococcoidia bacterium]|nr:hypothetical protein [Dehalococcoidia bacterium]
MEENQRPTLEKALAKTEEDANASLKAAQAVVTVLRRFHKAATLGNLRDLHNAIEAAEKAELGLRQQIATSKAGWDFNEEAYLGDGSFTREILDIARQKGVGIFERDDRLYCYPVLIRVSASERAVLIDKVREKRLRPAVLVDHLKELQKRPPRFSPGVFLEALYEAYGMAVKSRAKDLVSVSGTVIPLLEIYDLFTLLPGQSREYQRQEFARDVYLLDRSGVAATKNGANVSFPASTGTKALSRTLSVINEHGEEKRYYGIAFLAPGKE